MLRTLTAGLMALTLTFTTATSTQAQNASQEDIGKLIFGLLATVAIANAVKNNRDDRDDRVERHVTKPQIVRPHRNNPGRVERQQRRNNARTTLPRRCLNTVEGRFGTQRMLGKHCLNRNFAHAESLPRRCEVRVFTSRGPRNGFDPQCLRQQGFSISRR